jgi:dipeptidyl aminopeptidase/acylaminoacyl peptidase
MIKQSLFYLLVASVIGLQSCTQQQSHEPQQYTIDQFMSNESVYGGAFSADESKILVTSNKTGIYNAYAIGIEGGSMQPLTRSEKSTIRAQSFFPEDDRLLFLSDHDGNELFHLFVQDTDGNVKDLSPDSTARALFYGWAHDKKSFYMGWNVRDHRYMDLYELDVDNLQPRMLYENKEGFEVEAISNDKRYLALIKVVNTNDNDLYLYDLATKTQKKISESQASHIPTYFSSDGKELHYLTDESSEFKHLSAYSIESGKKRTVLQEPWDISYAYLSENGKYRIVGINEDGKTQVKIFDLADNDKLIELPDFEDGSVLGIQVARSEKKISMTVGDSRASSDIYVFDLDSKATKKLTNSLNPAIKREDLVKAEVVRYKSFDGVDIPAILYKPHQASASNKVPALVYVHGGPGGQTRQGYNPEIQFLVNHGYAILGVNNRGSSGYGKSFYLMDDRNHGEKDLQDCVEGKNYLTSLDWIDKEKIGIMGGSYGGFMTMAALTSKPEEFKAGVNYFGVVNWLRTLKSIPPWWETFKEALYKEMGDPVQDSVRLYRISPLFHADQIQVPLLVLQGSQDPRVLQVESDEIVAAARKKGVPVEYVLFPDEGHGFVKKENQIKASSAVLTFLDKYLKANGASASVAP